MDEQHAIRLGFAAEVLSGQEPQRIIRYYVLGTGQFRETADWPPVGVQHLDYALQAGSRLVQGQPEEGSDTYDVDLTASTGRDNRWYQFVRARYPDRAQQDAKLLTYGTNRSQTTWSSPAGRLSLSPCAPRLRTLVSSPILRT